MVGEAEQLGNRRHDAELPVLRQAPVELAPLRRQRLYRWWVGFLRKLPRRLVQLASAIAMFGGVVAPVAGYLLGRPLLFPLFSFFFVGKHYLLRPTDRSRPWWADIITSLLDRRKPPRGGDGPQVTPSSSPPPTG